jgi:hypothetical protein
LLFELPHTTAASAAHRFPLGALGASVRARLTKRCIQPPSVTFLELGVAAAGLHLLHFTRKHVSVSSPTGTRTCTAMPVFTSLRKNRRVGSSSTWPIPEAHSASTSKKHRAMPACYSRQPHLRLCDSQLRRPQVKPLSAIGNGHLVTCRWRPELPPPAATAGKSLFSFEMHAPGASFRTQALANHSVAVSRLTCFFPSCECRCSARPLTLCHLDSFRATASPANCWFCELMTCAAAFNIFSKKPAQSRREANNSRNVGALLSRVLALQLQGVQRVRVLNVEESSTPGKHMTID